MVSRVVRIIRSYIHSTATCVRFGRICMCLATHTIRTQVITAAAIT